MFGFMLYSDEAERGERGGVEPRDVELYRSEDGEIRLEVNVQGDTVWLTQAQMADLFGMKTQAITRHVKNILADGELDESTCSKMEQVQIEGGRSVRREVNVYNLDMVISIGYRVNSVRATSFRRWATTVLRGHLVEGYTVNDTRLSQPERVVQVLSRSENALASGIADVVSRYLPGLTILRDYDSQALDPHPSARPVWELTAGDARAIVARLRFSILRTPCWAWSAGRILSASSVRSTRVSADRIYTPPWRRRPRTCCTSW